MLYFLLMNSALPQAGLALSKQILLNQKIPLSYHTLKGVVCLGILGCSEMQHTLKCVVLEHF